MGTVQTGAQITERSSVGVACGAGRGHHAELRGAVLRHASVTSIPGDVASPQAQLAAAEDRIRQMQAAGAQSQAVPESAPVLTRPLIPTSFATFTEAEQRAVRDKAMTMERAGRLFVQRTEGGPLERARAFDLFQSLEYGQGGLMYVVDRYIEHTSSSESASESHYADQGWRSFHISDSSASRASGTTSADYASSPLFSWDSFTTWTSAEGVGLPTATSLPGPTGQVATTHWSSFRASRRYSSSEAHFFHPNVARSGWSSESYWGS